MNFCLTRLGFGQQSTPLRYLFAATAVLLLSLGASSVAETDAKQTTVLQPPPPPLSHFRVLWMSNPAETAMVAWTTAAEGTSHVVHYDTQPRQGRLSAYAFKRAALPGTKYTMAAADAGTPAGWGQNALLEKLTPATTYYFVVASDGNVSREFNFVTAPADDRPVKLLYGADSRPVRPNTGPQLTRRAMNRRIAALVEAQPDIMALAHGGDYDSYAEWRFMRDWLSDHELTITKAGRILPIIPARGNHDGREGSKTFPEVFYWPERTTPFYYTTPVSGQVAVVTLNSNASKSGNQREWLEAELRGLRATPGKWIILQYHVPSYPSVKSFENGAIQRQHWVPLFEKYQVDLVCEADDHMLKRTVPIFNDKHDDERGIIYIGDGGLGVPQRVPDNTRWYLKAPGMATPAHHVHVIECGREEMRVTAIGLEGDVLDQFVVKSKSAVAVPAH